MKRTEVITDTSTLHNLLFSPHIEVSDLYFPNDNTAWCTWSFREEVVTMTARASKNICLAAAAYTTSQARKILYRDLAAAGTDLLYCDTDSILWIENENTKYRPQMGSGVGQLADEIAPYGKDCYIAEWTCFGPKSYSYRIKRTGSDEIVQEIVKCKGLLNKHSNSDVLNFENMKKMLFDDHVIETSATTIVRKKHFRIETDSVTKKFQFTFTKRVVMPDFSTYPYGHYLIDGNQ